MSVSSTSLGRRSQALEEQDHPTAEASGHRNLQQQEQPPVGRPLGRSPGLDTAGWQQHGLHREAAAKTAPGQLLPRSKLKAVPRVLPFSYLEC